MPTSTMPTLWSRAKINNVVRPRATEVAIAGYDLSRMLELGRLKSVRAA